MTTLLVEPDELAGDELWLAGDRHRYLFRARRLAVGERLRVVDGAGRARRARVERVERTRALVSLGAVDEVNEPALRLELLVAPPRPQRAAWLVEKATEVGAAAVRFIAAERSPRRYGESIMARLRRVAAAAVEQSERAVLPSVSGVHPWPEIESLLAPAADKRVLDPAAAGWRKPVPASGWMALLIGPEGGWTPAERARLGDLGCEPVGLGPTVLRVETAAVTAAALALLAAQGLGAEGESLD